MTTPVERFSGERLTLARERRGLTQRKLSELVGVSDRMVKAYESGEKQPSAETLKTIAQQLRFPLSFFEAGGTLALEFHRFLSDRFDLPKPDVPDLRTTTPSKAAETVRHYWGLGQQPLANVIHTLERHGIVVFSLSEDCDEIDAFSVWHAAIPFVFLNTRKTAERSIFDAAHELGHLVLHRHGSPQGREAEREADQFAASFLMPESAIRAAAPRLVTVSTLAGMKQRWKVSVAALAHRLHELGLLSDWHYKRINIELSRRGRANEPAPIPRETSAVVRKTLLSLSEEGVRLRDIARELRLPLAELHALAFGLGVIDGDSRGDAHSRGELHVVD